MGMSAGAVWTVEMLDALPDDGQRYELIDGELYVTPAPSHAHQLVAAALHRRLHDYLHGSRARVLDRERRRAGRVAMAIRSGSRRGVQPADRVDDGGNVVGADRRLACSV
jgi:Uma2 family endonuclease